MTAAFTAWIDALATALSAPALALGPLQYKKGYITTRLTSAQVTLPLSAPNTVAATLWRHHSETYKLAREQPIGRWNWIVTHMRCDGAPHDRYLDLVAAMHAAGDTAQAQLAWMQARVIQDPDDRKDGLFVPMFGKVPRAATVDVARSAAALLERQLPFARSKSAVDRLIVALALAEHATEACFDVTGARRARFTEQVDRAITALTYDPEQSIRDAIRLARQTWAWALAHQT